MQNTSNKVVALGTLAALTASTLGTMSMTATPASASWVSRHRTTTAIAAVGGYLAYRHYKKKKKQQQYYRSANRYHSYNRYHRTY